ncbi:hypothetical protein Syun_012264 [Stephania yunnanensis]|uniref:Uncharacterized protein n=1 Tax=Stephania yunnanensis TaxID=152371 RepID=A0AAP0JZW5_9MAGN
MAFYSGKINDKDVVEPYHPKRILRQFGHVRSIPDPPYCPLEAHRGPFANKYSVKYGFEQDNWERWRNHVLAPEVRGEKTVFEFLATPDYLPWFVKVSHPVITNPSFEDLVMVASTITDNEILEVLIYQCSMINSLYKNETLQQYPKGKVNSFILYPHNLKANFQN